MEALFLKLLNMSLAAGWLVLAVITLRILLRQAPKWTRCLLWTLVAVRLLFPFSIESALSLIPSAEPLPREAITAEHPRLDTGIPPLNTVTAPIMERAFAPDPGDSVNPLQIYTALAAWLWLEGVAVMLLYALFSYLRLRLEVAASVPVTHDSFLCDAIDSPFILGVFRPRIYLPSGLAESQQSHVLAHERAHLKRRDHWWKPLGWLLLSIYWFHPLLWLAYFLFCRDIELACDEKVLRSLTEEQRIDYSQALLDLARPRAAVSACPVAFGETGVKDRVKSALSYKKPGFWIVLVAILSIVVTAVCLLTDPQKEETKEPPESIAAALEEEHHSPPKSKFAEIIDKLYLDRDLALVTRYYLEDATEEFFRDTEALYAAGDYDAIHELAFERRYVLMFYQDGRESEPYYLYSLDEEPGVVLKTLLESLYKDPPEVIVHNRGSADVTEAFREEMRPYYEAGDLFSIRYIIGERGYSMSRGPTIIFQGDARPVNVPSSSAAPVRVQAVVDALEPLMDVSTQPAVLTSRTASDGEVSGPYPLQNDPNLAHLANMLSRDYSYAAASPPHIDGMEEIRIECPELGWTASAYAALGEDTVELPGAWYFESSEYSGWLTYLSDVGDDGTFYFPSFYGSFRALAFDTAEYLSFSPELITPDMGQGWLAAAQELAPHCYDAALKVSPGSTYGLSYVAVTRIDPEEISEGRRQLDGLGEQDGEVSITVVFVPANEHALNMYMAGNTRDYTGGDPAIPEGAYEFGTECRVRLLEDGNWHLDIKGTG